MSPLCRKTTYVPGFYKIFDEILVNAADNKARDPTMDTIKVTIDKAQGSISVWNNGNGIPVEMHEKEGVYIPELIFGHLLTSSNYDDDEAKVTGGRNGYGAKLANIYSTEFTVETVDNKNEKKYIQVFSKNMGTIGKPKITKASAKDYTCITFKPDFARFKMDNIDADMEALMMKRVYDMAGTVRDIKVFLNGERLKIKGFKQYVEMYVSAIHKLTNGPAPAKKEEDGVIKEEGTDEIDMTAASAVPKPTIIFDTLKVNVKGNEFIWEVAFAVSDGEFRQVSFVNNIATIKGGSHVNMIENQIVARITEHVAKDKKNGPVKTKAIRDQMWIFVNCQIVNPTFDGQTKETLTLKPSAFGSKWTLSDDMAKKIMKSGIIANVLSFAKFQQEKQLKKNDGAKRNRITGIPKLEDANNAGTRKSSECTLILTEGDSAKALAVSGLTEVGRDNFGVFPLRGKLLNVREANHDQIMKNAEITNIKAIMGLKHNQQYTSVDSLRYGRLMIMTDQDHDGSHIKGLIINFLDHFFPTLLKQPDFLVEFITPIVKCTKGKQEISFFTIPEYEVWKEANNEGRGWVIKYYKGLGTSTSQDAKKYFRAMGKHMLPFETTQPGDRELIDLAFNKKKADDRKDWLRKFKPGTYLDHNIAKVPIKDFINKELILFSMADNARSIPSVVDGLKPGQRKVMFGCFKRKLRGEIKVAQLIGYVAEHSAYHHGETSLASTIVNLAQDFCGSNNVNILSPNGQFGTRLMGGKDAASARYIFTNVADITRSIYHPSDDALLTYLNDDGQNIEPEWYLPTVPLVLLNGSEGIGTGWSSNVPNYNPKDVLANLKRRLAGQEYEPMNPWYRGFTGSITPEDASRTRFKCTGIARQVDEKTWEITELPVKTWTSPYKEGLEERVIGTDKVPATIKEYKEYHTDTTVHFVVELNAKGQAEIAEKGAEVFFKLASQISTTNMVLFDQQGKIKKYSTPEEILDDFYLLRFEYYSKRKEHLVEELKMQYERLSNQARFVQMIISKELVVNNRKRSELVAELRKRDFRPFAKQVKAKVAADVDVDDVEEDDPSADTDFDYLLSMAIWSLTKEKVDKLLAQRDEKEKELNILLKRTPQNLWEEDLYHFEQNWEAILAEDDRKLKDVSTKGKKGKTAVVKASAAAKARKVIKGDDDMEEDDNSEDDFKPLAKPAAKKKSPAPAKAKAPTVKRSASRDIEAKPAPKKLKQTTLDMSTSSKVKAPVEEADEEDDYIVPLKPKKVAKAAAPKKAATKIDDGEEDEDDSFSMIDPPPKKDLPSRSRPKQNYSAMVEDSEEEDDASDDYEED
jgi:DNA topoisomerase-2